LANSASELAGIEHPVTPSRRDFLYVATATVGAVGAIATLVPLIDQMNPDAATLAAGVSVDVDVSKIALGSQIVVRWRERPIWIYHRSQQAVQTLKSLQDTALLSDPNSGQPQQPSYAVNWHRSIKPEFGVMVGICTHLGCVPLLYAAPSETSPVANWIGGYFCPCHGSKYDAAGRVYNDVPAPYNLPVPPHRYLNDTIIRIGENDSSDSAWSFDSIRQL